MAIKQTIPYNFDDTYKYIEQKFVDAGYDVQQGSNTMQLVAAMSYLTSMLNTNTAVNINEMLLTLARKRSNILQDARVLGYEIAHRQSYQYDLTLSFTNNTASPIVKNIVKYTSFTANGLTFYYVGAGFDLTIPPGGTTHVLRVKEGTLKKYTTEPSLRVVIESVTDATTGVTTAQHYIDIPFTNVEDDGIDMKVTEYDEFGDLQVSTWTRSQQFVIDRDTILNKEFVRLDNIDYKMPRVYFKLGDVGKEIRVGSIVEMNILQSSGANGAMTELPLAVSLDCQVLSYAIAIQGAEEEGIESIRRNAPLFYNSANRLVTKPDYVAFCNRQPSVKYSDVWDGNYEFPPKAGKIWFSFVPATLSRNITEQTGQNTLWKMQSTYDFVNWYIEPSEIQSIYTNLQKFSIPTLAFIHRHPVYMDFDYKVKIARYSANTAKSDTNLACFNIINDYFRDGNTAALVNPDTDTSAVETYNFEYFQSNLIKRVDRNLTDITGFDISLTTSIPLTSQNILNETIGVYEIEFHLGVPFEGVFDSGGNVLTNKLPIIDTDQFIGTSTADYQSIYVDYTIADTTSYTNVHLYSVYLTAIGANGARNQLTDMKIGTYSVINTSYQDIELTLTVTPIGETYDGIPINVFDLAYLDTPTNTVIDEANSGVRLNVVYPTPNIPLTRNTIARLNTVEFI